MYFLSVFSKIKKKRIKTGKMEFIPDYYPVKKIRGHEEISLFHDAVLQVI